MENYTVYMHTNKLNGKVYIGQTGKTLQQRWRDGKGYKSGSIFYNAIKKYGWDGFDHTILEENLTLEEANFFEKQYIDFYNALDRNYGYNCSEGGESHIQTPDVGRKISQKKLGHSVSLETREKIRKAKLGISHDTSEETKEKIRISNLGKKVSIETRQKISDSKKGNIPWNKGKKGIYSEETLQKMKNNLKGRTPWNKGSSCPNGKYIEISKEELENLYIKQNLTIKQIALKFNVKENFMWDLRKKYKLHKTKEQIKEYFKLNPTRGNLGKNFSDEAKKKMSESHKGIKDSYKTRKKKSEAMKRYRRSLACMVS